MHYESAPSIWQASQLLTWWDMGFLPGQDNTDIENYCSFMGAYDICTLFEGVIPIVHGPLSCASSYYATRIATRLKERIKPLPFCSSMEGNDVVFGSLDRLERVIHQVDEDCQPKLIVILTTCASEMINEDVQSLSRRLEGKIQADILPITVAGINCKGFREGADNAFRLLMDYVNKKNPSAQKKANSVNLFLRRVNGKLPDHQGVQEMKRMLAVNGISVNTVIRVGASYEELLSIPQAAANVSMCYTYGKGVLKHLQEIFDQPYSTGSYPMGLSGTVEWVQQITEVLGLEDHFAESAEVQKASHELERLRDFLGRKIKDKKGYIWHPGEKALAFVKLAEDLGLEPILIGFTYWTMNTTRETLVRMLNRGYDPQIIIRGHSMIWLNHEREYEFFERPLLFMPKKFWLGNLPSVDINLFRDHVLGLTGLKNIIQAIYGVYQKADSQNHSLFDRYIERRYPHVEWNQKIENLIKTRTGA